MGSAVGSLTFYYDSFDQYIVMVLLIHLLLTGLCSQIPSVCLKQQVSPVHCLPSGYIPVEALMIETRCREHCQGVDHPRLLWGSSVLKHTEGEEITSKAGQHGVVCPQAASV